MDTRTLWLGWGLALLGLSGCAECEEDYDCPGTQVCNRERGACEAFVCLADGDCAPGLACSDNACTPRPIAASVAAPDALVIPTR